MSEPEMGYVRASRGQIHDAEQGEEDSLLLFGETSRSYRLFDRLLPMPAPHICALAVNLLGLGNSHPLPAPISVPAVAVCLGEVQPLAADVTATAVLTAVNRPELFGIGRQQESRG